MGLRAEMCENLHEAGCQKMAGKAAEKVKDGACSSVPLFPWMSWTAVLVLRPSRLP